MKNKIAIIGYGYLGKAFHRFFEDHYEVIIYDPAYPLSNTKEEVNGCGLAVICVPTNRNEDGSADVSIVEATVAWLETPLIIIKSAVPPGTTDRLVLEHEKNIAISPEYMGESKYFTPFWKYPHPTEAKMHNFFVIGGEDEATIPIVDYFQRVMGPDVRVVKMRAIEAEVVKYMENSWGATKVTFANEFYEICKVFGADFQRVREGFLADGRVERMHTMVLPDKRGFGGKCFPKDVSAIVYAATQNGYEPKLLKEVLASNEKFVKKND